MALGILVLLSALSISAVAIYYSIAGLVAIFAAAAIPIMVMGTVLEVGKLVTAVWLHKYWSQAVWWLKTYLSVAVVVLMFITSMGIFGYLSKAHIEQTSASIESVEKISQLETEIARYTNIVERAEQKIEKAENAGANKNDTIQDQIDREQKRVDTAYDRVQPLVDKQQEIIQAELDRKDKKIEPYLAQVSSIDADLQTLSDLLNRRDNESIRKLQSIVGTRIDGTYGSRTAKQVENYRDGLLAKRESVLGTILQIEDKESSLIVAANAEIKRLRGIAENEIKDSMQLINKLRTEIGTVVTDNSSELIDSEMLKIKNASAEIDVLTEEKYKIEAEYRKLEAEVGPIKYIAEFIYGEEANRDLLEEAVRWVIILIIFVFDPLAVLLLIASQYTFQFNDPQRRGLAWREYEQARAKKILENEPPLQDEPGIEPEEEKYEDVDQETLDKEFAGEVDNTKEWQELYEDKAEEIDPVKERGVHTTVEKKDSESSEESKTDLDNWNDWVNAANAEAEKDLGEVFTPEQITERAKLLETYENDNEWTKAKRRWKDDNPDQNIKDWKQAYVTGKISDLPWARFVEDKEVLEEELDRIRPDMTEVIEPEGYRQNGEQGENSVWNKIRNKDK
ncbi:MAG: hypothetical protein CL815_00055 [Coraliomargarita sp.]|nr:hypothetical protein [Coraliomargarita sp.]|tara:strand:- start:2398 stop:4263 length:1866 start_codon:yes stop_codon:yes gene_type:complete